MEGQLKNRLIHLSCRKLVCVQQADSPLRRSLHLLGVVRRAREEGARFAPEITPLLHLPAPKKVRFAKNVTIHPIPNRKMLKEMAWNSPTGMMDDYEYPPWTPSDEFNPQYVIVINAHAMRKRKMNMHFDLVQKRQACVA
uniref:39S ribosomal protein L22, mitochondrial n=1 Tax=Panagrellus redivivus TaxID=6233 RepID=A0A7E4UVI5_PANRE